MINLASILIELHWFLIESYDRSEIKIVDAKKIDAFVNIKLLSRQYRNNNFGPSDNYEPSGILNVTPNQAFQKCIQLVR